MKKAASPTPVRASSRQPRRPREDPDVEYSDSTSATTSPPPTPGARPRKAAKKGRAAEPMCEHPSGCDRAARSGKLRMCVAHGGGRRCEEPGCNRAARARSGGLCAKHQSQAMTTPTVADDDSGLFDDYLGPELLSTDDAAFA